MTLHLTAPAAAAPRRRRRGGSSPPSPAARRLPWARRHLPWAWSSAVLPLALLAALLSLLAGPARWELDYALLASQPWRAVTGHLVHWSAEHLAWDLVVFTGLGLACEAESRARTAAALVLAAAALAAGLPLLAPEIQVYRGLSGLATALFALLATRCLSQPHAATRWAGAAALVGLAGKVAWEVGTGVPLFVGDTGGVAVVPAAHLLGALAGVAAGRARWRYPRLTAGKL